MEISNLSRYQKFFQFMLKYWNSDLMKQTANQAMDNSNEEELEEFNHSPKELVDDLKSMGPTYVKLGQLLSTRPDLLPNAYLEALADLQDDVEAIPYEEIHQIVEKEIGTRISKAFESFEKEPMASASIGQVHEAVLISGKKVAVKIRRPGVKEQFLNDLDTLQEIIEMAVKHSKVIKQYAFDDILEELRHVLIQELDYENEAKNLSRLRSNLADFEKLKVPKPVPDYSSQQVLTMEFIEGIKVTDISPLRKIEEDYAILVDNLVEAYLKQIIEDGFVHADPHPGNIRLTKDGKLALIDLGMAAKLTPKMRNFLLELLLGISQLNGEKTANTLLKMSEKKEDADIAVFEKKISRVLMESDNYEAQDLKTGRLIIQMNHFAVTNNIHLPVEINILGKVLMNIDQIIAALDPHYDLHEAIKRHTKKIMQRRMWQELKSEDLFGVLLELKHLGENLPQRVNQITKNLAENSFKMEIDALDERQLTQGFQKVANRITLGLIIASMIIGAAMLMQVPTDFSIFGYPGLAILLFLLAAVGGIYLSIVIIFKDK